MFKKIGFNPNGSQMIKSQKKFALVKLSRFISLCFEDHISILESTQILIMSVLYLILTTVW